MRGLSCCGEVAKAAFERPPAIEGCSNAHADGFLAEANQNVEPRTTWVFETFKMPMEYARNASTQVAKYLAYHTMHTCHRVELEVLVWHEGPARPWNPEGLLALHHLLLACPNQLCLRFQTIPVAGMSKT